MAKKLDALIEACEDGKLKQVKKLIRESPDLVNARWEYGWSPLHRAVMFSHLSVMKFLLASGGDVNAADLRGWTPLHNAATCQHEARITSFLVVNGAKFVANADGERPVHVSVQYGNLESFLACWALDYAIRRDLDSVTLMMEYARQCAEDVPTKYRDQKFCADQIYGILAEFVARESGNLSM